MGMLEILRQRKQDRRRRDEGERQILQAFVQKYGRTPELARPVRFSDKLCRRMILLNRHGNDRMTALADKLRVREYVASKIGEEHLTRIFWSGTNPDDAPLERLPAKSMAKTNHGSGGHFPLIQPINRDFVIRLMRERLTTNFYWQSREAQYYPIVPQAFIEEALGDGFEKGPLDYRFWCFNGKVALIQIDNNEHSICPFYDRDWNKVELAYRTGVEPFHIERPENFGRMIEIAEILSADFDFVRVDLYNLRGKIVFGELTFTPVAGMFNFTPGEWDEELGRMWG